MKDARELLQKLRAAGVEPMDDSYYTESAEACVRLHMQYHDAHIRERDRMIADLLEARVKLAEVREWAEDAARGWALGPESSEAEFAAEEQCTKDAEKVLERNLKMNLQEYLEETARIYSELSQAARDFRDSLLDAPVPGPPDELTWTFAHTPTEGQPSRRWLIGESLPAIYGCRIMAEITPRSAPPEKGSELIFVAPLLGGPDSAPSNNLGLALVKALPGGGGVKGVTGPGLAHDDKMRLEIPGRLEAGKVNLAEFVVNLRIPGASVGNAALAYLGKVHREPLGLESAPSLKPPVAVMIGGPRSEFWPGCHVRITITLFAERS